MGKASKGTSQVQKVRLRQDLLVVLTGLSPVSPWAFEAHAEQVETSLE